jgi:hypothetical protein
MRSGSVILARVRRAENPGTARANCFLGAGWVPAKMRRRGTAATAALNEVKGLGAAVVPSLRSGTARAASRSAATRARMTERERGTKSRPDSRGGVKVCFSDAVPAPLGAAVDVGTAAVDALGKDPILIHKSLSTGIRRLDASPRPVSIHPSRTDF